VNYSEKETNSTAYYNLSLKSNIDLSNKSQIYKQTCWIYIFQS